MKLGFFYALHFFQERLRIEIKGPELKRSISTGGAKTGVAAKSKQQLLLAAAVKRKSGSDTSKGAQVGKDYL